MSSDGRQVFPHLFVLVGGDGDELRLLEGNVGNQTMARADADDVELRLVLMEGVQHHLQRKASCSEPRPLTHLVPVQNHGL